MSGSSGWDSASSFSDVVWLRMAGAALTGDPCPSATTGL